MLLVVFGNSFFPVAVASTSPVPNPFLLYFCFAAPNILIVYGFLTSRYRTAVLDRGLWLFVARKLRTPDGVLAMTAGLGLAFFVAATSFLDTAIVTVIFGAWVIPFIISQRRKDPQQRYHNHRWDTWVLLTVSCCGVGFVTFSQTQVAGSGLGKTLAGVTLASAGTILASFVSYRFRVGTQLWYHHQKTYSEMNKRFDELGAQILVMNLFSMGALIISFLILAATSPQSITGLPQVFVPQDIVILTSAAGLSALASIAFRAANLNTTNLSINSMTYLTPLVAVTWLWAANVLNVTRPDLLVLGTVAVVTGNLLVNTPTTEPARTKPLSPRSLPAPVNPEPSAAPGST